MIFDPNNDRKVIEIRYLKYLGGNAYYDVTFREQATPEEVYGSAPGEYEFPDRSSAEAAVTSINDALNQKKTETRPFVPLALWVGSEGGATIKPYNQYFLVGYSFKEPAGLLPARVETAVGHNVYEDGWVKGASGVQPTPYHENDSKTYAVFTEIPPCSLGDCDDGLFCNGEERCVNGVCEAGTPPCEANEDCNGETDSCDSPPQPCAGDLNNDGAVDVEDFGILLQDWGRTDCPIQ